MQTSPSSKQLVDEEDQKKPSYLTQYLGAFSACMGSLCFGVVLGYSSPAGAMLTADRNLTNSTGADDELHLSDAQNTLFGSIVNVGAILGGPVGGLLINQVGRRGTMLMNVVVFSTAWLLTIFAQNFAMLLTSRIVAGLATGIMCIAANTYIGELASVEVRGMLGSGFQLMTVTGIEYTYIFGAIVDSWQILAIICFAPVVLFCALMLVSKESPVYLLSKGKEKEAIASLQYFRGKDYDVQNELDTMRDALEESQRNKTSIKDLVNSYLVKPLMISLALMFFQQFSGINAVIFNLSRIFHDAGTTLSDDISSIIVGLVQVLATLSSSALIERAGRKILLIASAGVMSISLIALGVFFYLKDNGDVSSLGWLPLVSLILFIAAFSIGYGPIPWILMSELFPRAVVGEASSLSTMMNWSMSFACTALFDPLQKAINMYGVYWLFGGICALNVAFCVLIVPETKGKTSEEINAYFGGPAVETTYNSSQEKKGQTNISYIS